MTRSVSPWCLKRRTSLIRRIDNLWVGIGLPHWLNEKPVARLSCRPKRPAPPKGAHDRLKSLLTIPRNTCSRCSEIRAHDPAKRAHKRRGPNQGDRPQNRAQPSTRSPCQPRPKHGYLSYPAEHTRRSLTVPGRAMGRGMSERDRALAPSAGAGLPGFLTCRQRMEDKAATSGEGD